MNVAARYPAYAETRSDALGPLPETWSATQLKRVVDECRQITYGIVQAGPNVEGGVPYVRPADMHDEAGVRDLQNLLRTSEAIASNYRRSAIASGDLVCSIGPSFGKVMVVPEGLTGGNLTQGTARVAISHKNSARFFFWALRSPEAFQQWESSVGGATFRALNLGPLAETRLPLPPLEEQTQIANFLDYETAKIDVLIEKQQQLIRLLKEKRHAVISHAVTKGLNPDAPMRDSDVEWLGEVPVHWRTCPLMHIVDPLRQVMYGIVLPGPNVDDGVPIVKGGDVKPGRLTLAALKRTTFEIEGKYARSRLRENDLVYAIRGGVGDVELVPAEIEGANLTQDAARIAPARGVLPNWLLMSLRGDYFCRQVERKIVGATVRGINIGDLKRCIVAVPPKEEQIAIAKFLQDRLDRLGNLQTSLETFLGGLQERRTALISAAVTGKIDVRGWSPPVSATSQKVA